MKYKITLIPGDGTGPDVTKAAVRCIEATGVNIEWEEFLAGEGAIEKYGTPLPQDIIASVKKNKIALKGPITTPIASGFRSVNVALRQSLELFACLRPAKSIEGVISPYKNIDLVIIRENSEDLYAGIEFEKGAKDTEKLISLINKLSAKKVREDSGISIKPISEFASRRIIDFAFKYAAENNRKKVTVVHKANIMKYTDGLFLKIARDIASKNKNIGFEEAIVDNLCMQLVLRPHNFDVLVLPNLYGDIISDLCAGLIGGLGIAPGANIGKDCALFEPVHGAAPKYKGLNKVNPTATIQSGVMMLRYINEDKAADKLESALKEVIKEGKFVTYDLKKDRNDPSAVGTQQMADAIIKKMK
ncbi:MAG: isocitrate/isopropylmalate dehydrogenase family protein [Candidatus Omnitrophica bacterium]|nr:isocitrate/isopropylmalate dehydrogenase family protein [Candidatus Omnitrophota bacterium]MDD5352234.1 isocitrate/isopropylmalate dehydrogenase family protein [Candidatus Omnitrophota bacterium]MDD5549832.1 isocitrate/isopropylmalate dehydrogenase family protein [Candidatus Omnitrophota bacterium]